MQITLRRPLAAAAAAAVAVAVAALIAACAAGTAATGPSPAAEGTAEMTGRYHAILMDVGNVLPRTNAERLTIWVERLTPDDEVARLADLQQGARQETLRDELFDREVGRVQVGQGLSYPIAAALAFAGRDGLRHLVLVIARPISFGEIFAASRSLDYPFSVIELDLEDDGGGSGELNVAARVSLNIDGRVVVDDLAVRPLRILGVERVAR
jgi:hypothetical protein